MKLSLTGKCSTIGGTGWEQAALRHPSADIMAGSWKGEVGVRERNVDTVSVWISFRWD